MSKQRIQLFAIHITLILLSFVSYAQPADQKALLWKISGKDLKEASYLFGTYHLLGDKFLAEVPETDAPFKNAKGIIVETVIDSSKLFKVAMMAVMPDNKLSNLLTPEEFKMVSDTLATVMSMNLKTMDMFKPSQVAAMLVMMQSTKLNSKILDKYSGLPLDFYFATQGKAMGKTVTTLETMEEQMKMLLDQFPLEEQARQLVELVKLNHSMKKNQIEMLDLYLKKDMSGLLSMMESYPKELGEMDYLLKDRNEKWIKVLPAIMRSGQQFIAVGAAHLLGKDGLIALLTKEGYKVEPVTQ